MGMLSCYRALELGDKKSCFCGKLLADLGMDIIKIEPPGGDTARNIGPFYEDTPHPEKSLFWFAYNTGKRSITLDLDSEAGRQLFRKLAQNMDVVIESFPPGYMRERHISFNSLRPFNQRLVMASITPFGQRGPYANFRTTDLVSMAMGGLMYLTGDEDAPPVRISFPQSYFLAGSEAAAAISIALYHCGKTGKGQYIDLSLQQCLVWSTMTARPVWDTNQIIMKRAGPYRQRATADAREQQIWECKDGYVAFVFFTGRAGVRSQKALVEWMKSEGFSDEFIEKMDWETLDMVKTPQEFYDKASSIMTPFFKAHTKKELYEGALKRRIMLNPVSDARDLFDNAQLRSRRFWVEVEHSALARNISYPGPFVSASNSPVRLTKRAPLIGEHNEEIYCGELGLNRQELIMLKENGII